MSGQLIGIREAGPRALLLEFADLEQVLAHHQHLTRNPLPGQREAVAAARTILLRFEDPRAARRAREEIAELRVDASSTQDTAVVELEVVYDGEDLAEVAALVGMSVEALIDWHTAGDWTGAFGGFAPGFTYCVPTATDRALDVPRRTTPRTALPAGSVALAGEFSAVYPRVSPGGWQLIGRTAARMWDLERTAEGAAERGGAPDDAGVSPALVRPGDTVRYRAVREAAVLTAEGAGRRPGTTTPQQAAGVVGSTGPAEDPPLEVLAPGLLTLIQDFGREGLSDLGVSRAGVADEPAMRQANRLVGNTPGAPVLEALHGGLSLRTDRNLVIAVAGAEGPLHIAHPDGGSRSAEARAPFLLAAGESLTVGAPHRGLRAVLAVRGGIAVGPVLGSASADTMSGLGPAPLQAGDRIALGAHAVAPVGAPEPSTLPVPEHDGAVTLRFTCGPRDDWFSEQEVTRLQTQRWEVTQESNRIGIRLGLPEGESTSARPLERARDGELPSEGVPRGSLQMPPAGLPVLFLNDHPVTGGYPVIGVVIEEDLSAAAQLAPGDVVRLRAVDPVRLRAVDPVRLRAVDPSAPMTRTPSTTTCEDPV
ncbi:carboxyltransferase domain-containing protein [Nesterenkonia xinjiangensis]|uniref:KipI family sensor histidine kinase inhibitor n=1 Tax=Nesterenkonia xinjiangensis TaxID=225327 RepID=A0A7Z0KCK5_9MICC|nr:carboxyltransferase domain-containing protein [Nesterenkonia xinjiangensis]NYJ78727.1 KipI family sensor histidine kinase inhibitor [Nesterenkonia xinjiangensis]